MARKSNMTIVDQLGTLQAEIAGLQAQEKELKQALIDEGVGIHDGDLFQANVIESERRNVAWKAIAEKLGASAQMIAGNTKVMIVTSVKVTARKVVK